LDVLRIAIVVTRTRHAASENFALDAKAAFGSLVGKLHGRGPMLTNRCDEELSELVRTRDELRTRREEIANSGARGFRLETIQIAILGIEQDIRQHCAETNLPLPAGVSPTERRSRSWVRSEGRPIRLAVVGR